MFVSNECLTEGKARASDIEKFEFFMSDEEHLLSGSEYEVSDHGSETDAAEENGEDGGEDDDLLDLELNSVSAIKAARALVSCSRFMRCG